MTMPEGQREVPDDEVMPWDGEKDLPEWVGSDADAMGGYATTESAQ